MSRAAPPPITRFAPSPNGPLHLGHAYSAIIAHDLAQEGKGAFLLRIEDIDGPRSRPELPEAFRADLSWLGLSWTEVPAQSSRLETYAAAAARLQEAGFLYPCTCTRRQVAALPKRVDADGLEYPGSPRGVCPPKAGESARAALRLDIERALKAVGDLFWEDDKAGTVAADPRPFGDVVLVRGDLPASYHLAATIDDAADGVTLVTRGDDLFTSTHIHRVLQALLDLPVPRYHHHRLLLDHKGEKLAKRKGSPALSIRREAGEDGTMLAAQLRLQIIAAGT
ncbi:MAG: tRNA glutamyl-Q(34) synthetase GluQRS [Erythrobacter sp.]